LAVVANPGSKQAGSIYAAPRRAKRFFTEGSEENEDCDLRLGHSFAIRHSGFVILLIRVVGEIRGQK